MDDCPHCDGRGWAPKVDAEQDRDDWKARAEALAKPELIDLHMVPDQIDMTLRHPVLPIIVEAFVKMFDDSGAKNFVEFKVWVPERGFFVLNLQRQNGVTPNDLRLVAEKKLADVETQAAAMRELLIERGSR